MSSLQDFSARSIDGRVLGRYSPTTRPEKIAADIEQELAS
ncbi:MAG: hypothetical protein JWM79_1094 [Nocardioides sp.]|jgi:glutathione peroxidase-family protein|nr:hypothetical protein [Nocardioides sp.]